MSHGCQQMVLPPLPPLHSLLSPVAMPKARGRPAAGSKTIGADAAPTAVSARRPPPPPLPPPPQRTELTSAAVAAGRGCTFVGCAEASGGVGHAAVTLPLPPPPPLCSRALPLELAVTLSRCMLGRRPEPSGGDGVQPSQQASQQSLDDDAVEEGELLGERRDPVSGRSVQLPRHANTPAQQAEGAGGTARTDVLVAARSVKASGCGAETTESRGAPAPVPLTTASQRQRGSPAPLAARVEQSAGTAHQGEVRRLQSPALLLASAAPSSPAVAASAASAACVPIGRSADRTDKAAATADQQASSRAAARAAASKAQAPAEPACAPAAATCVPQERTATKQAASQAAAERETSLWQVDQQARVLGQVRVFEQRVSSASADALGKPDTSGLGPERFMQHLLADCIVGQLKMRMCCYRLIAGVALLRCAHDRFCSELCSDCLSSEHPDMLLLQCQSAGLCVHSCHRDLAMKPACRR